MSGAIKGILQQYREGVHKNMLDLHLKLVWHLMTPSKSVNIQLVQCKIGLFSLEM